MSSRKVQWPWTEYWLWFIFIVLGLVIAALIWIPYSGGCSSYSADYQGDTSCRIGPLLGFPGTWLASIVPVSLLIWSGFGLARAVRLRSETCAAQRQ